MIIALVMIILLLMCLLVMGVGQLGVIEASVDNLTELIERNYGREKESGSNQ